MQADFTGPVILLILLSLTLYIAYYMYRDVLFFLCMQLLGKTDWFVSPARQQFIRQELEKIDYYRNMSESGKRFFFHRVLVFMLNKNFFGDGIQASDEVRVVIAASAVQLTFRIRGFYIDHIQLIRVFPHSVWSQMARHQVKGLTMGSGVMWLSWADVKKGFEFPDDGINLGLHEMAHAFMLTVRCGENPNHRICRRIKNWRNASMAEYTRLRAGSESIFRKYGGTNGEEFFAVNVECFYEKPEELSVHHPDIYLALCRLFNQDPLNPENDYKLGLN